MIRRSKPFKDYKEQDNSRTKKLQKNIWLMEITMVVDEIFCTLSILSISFVFWCFAFLQILLMG